MIKFVWTAWFMMLLCFSGCKKKDAPVWRLCSRMDADQILLFFPKTVENVQGLGLDAKGQMDTMMQDLAHVASHERTFANTIRPYDGAKFKFYMQQQILTVMAHLSDDATLQYSAQQELAGLKQYEQEKLIRNPVLYQAFKEYNHGDVGVYHKKSACLQFVHKMLEFYRHQGILLSDQEQMALCCQEKEMHALSKQLQDNYEQQELYVLLAALPGVNKDFVASLKKDGNDFFMVPLDVVTYQMMMKHCTSSSCRKTYFLAFAKQMHWLQEVLLPKLLQQRFSYAQQLGFDDYAGYALHDCMACDVKKVETFLWRMVDKLQDRADAVYQAAMRQLPCDVILNECGLLQPWDQIYVLEQYKNNKYGVDQKCLAQYFPLEQTLEKLLQELATFFYIEFKKEPVATKQLWASDVVCYRVYSLQSQTVLGYLFFDLQQRAYKKIKGPCYFPIIPAIKDDCSLSCAGACVVAANFRPVQNASDILLSLHDLQALIHQIGLAFHDLFGATCFVDYSGTKVKKDFVQIASWVLESWLFDASRLQRLSGHYKTGQVLSQDVIERYLAAKESAKIPELLHEALLGLVSLYAHTKEALDPASFSLLFAGLHKKIFKQVAYQQNFYGEHSLPLLVDESASYYAHLWSRVIAQDVFAHIKKFDAGMGIKYAQALLYPGGFLEPAHMIKRFLKRPWNDQAFFAALKTSI